MSEISNIAHFFYQMSCHPREQFLLAGIALIFAAAIGQFLQNPRKNIVEREVITVKSKSESPLTTQDAESSRSSNVSDEFSLGSISSDEEAQTTLKRNFTVLPLKKKVKEPISETKGDVSPVKLKSTLRALGLNQSEINTILSETAENGSTRSRIVESLDSLTPLKKAGMSMRAFIGLEENLQTSLLNYKDAACSELKKGAGKSLSDIASEIDTTYTKINGSVVSDAKFNQRSNSVKVPLKPF